jgi:predicted DNA-binding protein (MmcQ/YjbR family)
MGGSLRNEISEYITSQYASSPEYLWAKYPNYAVFRHMGNKKWFAVIMDIPYKKLDLDKEGITDILNIKVSPLMAGSLELNKGILPAYHMKKGAWVSILLDGSVDKEQITALIAMSYELTDSKKKR